MSHEKFELLKMLFGGGIFLGTLVLAGFFVLRWNKQRLSAKPSDLSAELQAAIQGEFERLRQENSKLNHRLSIVEKQLNNSANRDEVIKQQQLEQKYS